MDFVLKEEKKKKIQFILVFFFPMLNNISIFFISFQNAIWRILLLLVMRCVGFPRS